MCYKVILHTQSSHRQTRMSRRSGICPAYVLHADHTNVCPEFKLNPWPMTHDPAVNRLEHHTSHKILINNLYHKGHRYYTICCYRIAKL